MTWRPCIMVALAIWCLFGALLMLVREATEFQLAFKQTKPSGSSETHGPVTIEINVTTSEVIDYDNDSYEQPDVADKFPFMEAAESIPDDKRICFVHVGKTAGSTLACYLGFDYDHCATGMNDTGAFNNIPSSKYMVQAIELMKRRAYKTLESMVPQGNLAHYTTSMIHKEYDSCFNHEPINMYLFVIRNPLSRIQSWFEYEKIDKNTAYRTKSDYIKKQLFIDCGYSTLNLLGIGLNASNDTLCSQRALDAISGTVGYLAHNKYNYRFYYEKVLMHQRNPRIIVIRTEHLEADWSSIETKLLGGPPLPNGTSFSRKNQSRKRLNSQRLDVDSKRNICKVLCHEIQIYKKLLRQAENLDEISYTESMHELAVDCPVEVGQERCL